MEWTFDSSLPVYQQITAQIRGAVLSGEYLPGSRIPPVRELATVARVNPNTMQRALAELERDGLLVSGGAAGRFVTEDRAVLEQLRRDMVLHTAKNCMRQFATLGISPAQAAEILLHLQEEDM